MDDDPATEILEATYRTLCEHGYANLTLEDVAAEADRSKASIHYHYDSKENLLSAFLDFLYDRYTDQIESTGGETPQAQLRALLDTLLANDDADHGTNVRTAMLEVTAQAPYDGAVRARLTEFDELLFERVRELVTAGIDAGEFDESVDPELTAQFLATTITGAHTRQVALDHSIDRHDEAVIRYVEAHLAADDASEVTH